MAAFLGALPPAKGCAGRLVPAAVPPPAGTLGAATEASPADEVEPSLPALPKGCCATAAVAPVLAWALSWHLRQINSRPSSSSSDKTGSKQ